jgi:hypothetical protein
MIRNLLPISLVIFAPLIPVQIWIAPQAQEGTLAQAVEIAFGLSDAEGFDVVSEPSPVME